MKKLMQKVWRRKKGFTLIELLIVVAIIGILAGIAIPNFLGARTKARVSRAFSDMRSIGNALEMYYIDNTAYPTTPDQVDTALVDTYMSSIPTDPFNDSDGGGRVSGTTMTNAIKDDSYGYAITPDTSPTNWLLISNGPDGDVNVDENNYTTYIGSSGQFGGSETQYTYGSGDWYNPASGTTSSGDLGLGGP